VGRTSAETLELLLSAQRALRSRWQDFRQAFERRDGAAYRVALMDFLDKLCRWTAAEENALLPALGRTAIAGRESQRELKLEYVQIRELTRYLQSQIAEDAPLSDILGIIENLERRLTAHESETENVYYPAGAGLLNETEIQILRAAAPPA